MRLNTANQTKHRTIDKILNASDSSMSSSPPTSPQSIHIRATDPKQEVSQSVNDAVSISFPKVPSKSSISETLTVQSKPGSFACGCRGSGKTHRGSGRDPPWVSPDPRLALAMGHLSDNFGSPSPAILGHLLRRLFYQIQPKNRF
jgi:hypothetical protein